MATNFEAKKPTTEPVPYLLSLPVVVFLGALYLLPLGSLVIKSFTGPDQGAESGALSLQVYAQLLQDPYNLVMIWRTFKVSFLTTLICLVLAFPVALYLRQISPRQRFLISFLLLSPLLTSVVVRTLAWVILLAPRGILNEALVAIGFSRVNLIYNEIGIIIGLTHVFFGYMVLSLMTSILRIDENLLRAANNLGASNWRTVISVVLPLSLPGVLAGTILVFSMCASTFATPRLLGGSTTKVLSAEIYELAINYLEWKEAAALACILFLLIAAFIWIGSWLMESGRRRAIFQ